MRKTSALLVAAGLTVALSACTGASGDESCYGTGDASDVIDVSGPLGEAPTIGFPTPIITKTSQAATIIAGDGDDLEAGQPARVEISILNGRTGDELQATTYDGLGTLVMVGESTLPAVGAALECAKVGSRIAIAASAEDGHKSIENPQLGVAADDTFVFVVDVLEAFLPKADGAPQLPKAGDPAVVVAPNGAPGITIPKSGQNAAPAPEDLVVSVLKKGDGAELEEGKTAVLQYTAVLWEDNEVFDSSWERGEAATFSLTEGDIIPGFLEGLAGQTVGSQVLVVIPPELGYGDEGSGTVPGGATLVFVIDVLGIAD